ncbi:MAG: sialidase family protein, partial [Acidimicrobiales bacterium]
MRRRRTAARGVALSLVLAGLTVAPPARGQAAQAPPRVTAAVQVTANLDPARGHSSPQIAVNPLNGELVIGEGEARTTQRCNTHISTDGGRSWSPGGNPMVEPFTNCTLQATNGNYISLHFDPRGVLWAAFLGSEHKFSDELPRADVPRHVYLARSEDSGRTWTTTRAFEGQLGDPGTGGTRRPLVAVDPRDPQTIYIGWQKGGTSAVKAKGMVSISRDGGRTFEEPLDLSDSRGSTQPRVTVDGQGVVHTIFTTNNFGVPTTPEAPTRPLYYRRSTDGGRTWSEQREIDPHNALFSFGRKSLITADPSSSYVYVTWYGNVNPRARRPAPNAPSTDEFDDREIFVRVSPDSGLTWGEARLVNDDAARRNIQHYDSTVSIAPNGRVDIAWYDFR